MSAGPPTAVVFDIGRVLVQVDVTRAVRRVAELAGVGEFEAEFALFGPHYRRFARGAIDGPAFHAEVCRHLERTIPYDRFTLAWCDMFDDMPGMEPLVAALAQRAPIFLCSNTDPLHYGYLRAHSPLLSYARGAALSFEIGSEKPELEIYRALLARCGLDPARTAFVDDREENVAAAIELGMAGLVFESAEDLRADLIEMGVLSG